jgi:hypothetical protein
MNRRSYTQVRHSRRGGRHAGMKNKEVESACKPGSVRLATRQSFLSARRRRLAPATYPGTTRAALSFPYLVLLRVGFTVPRDVSPVRGALLPHPFTLTTHIRRCRSAVCSLLHWPSAHAAQELPGTLPYGARTFLDALTCDATARPTPPPSLVAASHVRDVFRGSRPVSASEAQPCASREDQKHPSQPPPASMGRSEAGRQCFTAHGAP